MMTANMILATRPPLLEQWLGGLDRVYALHKTLGIGVILTVLLHSQVEVEQSSGVLPPGSIGETAAEVAELVLYPFLALLLISGIKRLPKLPFEIPYGLWRWSHRLMGVAFLALAFHQLFVKAPFRPNDLISQWLIAMALIGALAFLLSQVAPFLRRRAYRISEVEALPGATRIVAEPMRRKIRARAGQFAFLSIRKSGLREPHPFTLSAVYPDGRIEFSIRPSGDFTRRVQARAAVGDRISVEGGYGRFTPQKGGANQIWIAGGIGITPFLAAADALGEETSKNIVLIHSVRGPKDAVGAERLKSIAAKHETFDYYLHDSQIQGRLTGDKVQGLLPFDLRDAGIWFCGPVALRKALLAQFRSSGKKPNSIHFEKFEFR